MTNYDGSLNFDTKINTKGFNKDIGVLEKSVKKLGLVIAAAFGVRALIRFGKQALQVASDLTEVQNVVDVAFGNMAEYINEFAKTALDKFGLSELSAKKYASSIGAMGSSMGFAAQQNKDMSLAVTGLIGDFASFYNIEQDMASTALKSIWTGETETLKRYGILITEVNLQEYARQQGITKTIAKMTQQEKVMLRYNYVLDATQNAQGDFLRTQSSWANQTRILTERWKQFLGLIGQNLINVFTPAINMLNNMLSVLIGVTEQFNSFYSAVTGSQIQQQSQVTSSIGDSVDEQDNLTSAVEDTNAELKKSLAGFDELNVLQDSSTTDASAATSGISSTINTDVKEPEIAELNPVFENMVKLLEPLQDINFDSLNNSLDALKEKTKPLNKNLFSGLLWLYNTILVPLSTWTIENALPLFFDALAVSMGILNTVIEVFKPFGVWLWDNFLQPLAGFAAEVFLETMGKIIEQLTKFSDWAIENKDDIENMAIVVGVFFGLWKLTQILAFIEISGGLIATIKLITSAVWLGVFAKIADKVQTVALTLLYAGEFLVSMGLALKAIILQTGTWIAMTATKLLDWAATLLLNASLLIYNGIMIVTTAVTTAFATVLTFLLSPIGLVILAIIALIAVVVFLITHWETVAKVAKETWAKIIKVWEKADEWVRKNVNEPLGKLFTDLWDGIKESFVTAFDFIKGAFVDYVNGWTSIIESFFNFFVNGINSIIDRMNRISVDIPDWVPEIGGKSFGFDISRLSNISLPRLATGAVIPPNAEFAAILGDQKSGTNIEAPADLIRQIVREETANNGNGGEITLVFTGDLAEMARIMKPSLDDEGKRKGYTMKVVTV